MSNQPVTRRVYNLVRIKDKQGKVHAGFVVGLAEKCGNHEIDGQAFYATEELSSWTNEQFALVNKKLKIIWDCAVDYLVWDFTHGDNDQYISRICPGDLLLFIDGKIVPVIGELRELMFEYEHYTVDAPLEKAA